MKINLWILCYLLMINVTLLKAQEHNSYTISELDSLCQTLDRQDRTIEGYKYALLFVEKSKGTSKYIQALFFLAIFQAKKLDYEKSEETCAQIFSLLGEDKQSLVYAKVCLFLGNIYYQKNKFREAELQYLEVKALLKNYATKNDDYYDVYNDVLNNLGGIYFKYNELESAKQVMLEVLEVTGEKFGKKSLSYVISLGNLAIVYENLGEIKQAQRTMNKALEISKKSLGKEHLRNVRLLLELARLYYRYGDPKKGEPILFRCLKILENELGHKNELTIRAIMSLGTLNYYKNTPLEGLKYAKECFAINSIQPLDTTNWDDLLKCLVDIDFLSFDILKENFVLTEHLFRKLYDQEKEEKWLNYLYALYKIQNKINRKVRNSFRTEIDKLQLTRENALLAQKGIKVAMELGCKDCMNSAFLFAEENKSALLAQQLKNDKAKIFGNVSPKFLEKEQKLQKKLSLIMGQLAEVKVQDDRRDSLIIELNKANQEILMFQKTLKKMYPKYHSRKYDNEQLSLEKLQMSLGKKQALLEYLIADSVVYVFVITHNSLKVLPLSILKTELKQQVENFRKVLTNINFVENHGLLAYRQYCQSAYWFFEHIIKEALDYIDAQAIHQIIIVPDGELGHLPFETFLTTLPDTMVLNEYRELPYLLHKYEISYSYSAALWYENKNKKVARQTSNLLAYAPIYGQECNQKELLKKYPERLMKIRRGLRPLPESITEVKELEKLFDGICRTREAATEHQFKQDLSSHSIIHLATHGILNKEHPLLSSLAFTETGDTLEDNFLQAYEISQMDVNAQLVVLSACETGFGEFKQGEGIMSLARSFMYAGAPALVVSLWRVNDLSTSIIMQLFYEQITKGQRKSKALQQTKLAYLEHVEGLASHPIYWAPFIQLGNSQPVILNKKERKWIKELLIGFAILIALVSIKRILTKPK